MAFRALKTMMKLSARPCWIALPLVTSIVATINAASANTVETFAYSSYGVTGEQTINILTPNAIYGGMGQIVLTGTYTNTGGPATTPEPNPILAWCLDVYSYLFGNGTYTVSPLLNTTNEVGFGTSMSSPSGTLSQTQINEIGALIVNGDALIKSGGDANTSAAIQLAIWQTVYGSSFSYNGVSSATTTEANKYLLDVTSGTWQSDPNVYLLTENGNQTLAFDVDGPLTPPNNSAPATPLPAAFPLFATGLAAIALLGRRRRRKPAGVASA